MEKVVGSIGRLTQKMLPMTYSYTPFNLRKGDGLDIIYIYYYGGP